MRAVTLVVIVLFLVPVAAAAPYMSVGVGPNGPVTSAQEPYYLYSNVTQPEAPHGGPAWKYDCAYREPGSAEKPPAQTPMDVAARVLANPPDPTTFHSVSPWFPQCIVVNADACGTPATGPCRGTAYISYHPATGRYYIDSALLPGVQTVAQAMGYGTTGTTGLELTSDCDQCPPPFAMLS